MSTGKAFATSLCTYYVLCTLVHAQTGVVFDIVWACRIGWVATELLFGMNKCVRLHLFYVCKLLRNPTAPGEERPTPGTTWAQQEVTPETETETEGQAKAGGGRQYQHKQ